MTKIDGLIARLTAYAESDGKVIFPTFQRLCADAAAALREQRDEIAEIHATGGTSYARLQRAEAEVAQHKDEAEAQHILRIKQRERAEKAEAERDALRVLVSPAAEQAMRDLRAERDAAMKDAERYRWLRSHPETSKVIMDDIIRLPLHADVLAALDAAIDATMKGKP